MTRIGLYIAVAVLGLHGLIHLMGLVAYWPLATIPELPYKTVLAGGAWEVGPQGMRIYSLFWLVACASFLLSAIAIATGQEWWRAVLLPTLLLSTAIIALDWAAAFRGAILNGLILLMVLLLPWLRAWAEAR